MDAFLAKLKEDTKITIYALPLLSMSKFSFDGFVSSYINREGTYLCVEVGKDVGLRVGTLVHPAIRWIQQVDGKVNFWYTIPPMWWPDMMLIIQGRYSELSEAAKSMIRTYSGLAYRQSDPDGYELYTDYRLLALDKAPALRKKWEKIIHPLEPISQHVELMEPPGADNFREFRQ